MSQFNTEVPFPYVATVPEWLKTMADAWEWPHVVHELGLPCDFCAHINCEKCCDSCGKECFCDL